MIPRDAVELEDWKLADQGLPVPKKPKVVRPDPEPPHVPNQLKFEDIPQGEIRDISARGRSLKNAVRNAEGQIFVGMDVSVAVGDKVFEGWMAEKDFLLLKRRIPPERIDLLQKIGW